MSDKYIIRNCPCYNNERFIGGFLDDKATFCTYYGKKCQGCTDCVMKQIVEKCKNYKESCKIEGNCLDERLCSTCFLGGANELGEWILDDLDIEEVE